MGKLNALKQIPDVSSRFRELCLLYSELLRGEGVSKQPFASPGLPVFSALLPERQRRAVDSITLDLELFEAMQEAGYSLRDSPKLLWRALGRLGLAPSADIFDKISDQDAVEVYLLDSASQQQIFRNLQWLGYCSYTVEQLASLDWRISAERDEKYVRQIGEAAMAIMTGQRTETFAPGIEPHLVREVDSAELLTVRIDIKYLSPVRSQGRVVGAITVLGVEQVGAGNPSARELQ